MSFISKLLNKSGSPHSKNRSQQTRGNKKGSKELALPGASAGNGGDNASDEDDYALCAENSRHVHSDPVPSSFKNSSFAGMRVANESSGLTVDVASAGAFSSDSCGASPCSPPVRRRSSMLERPRSPMVASGSFKSPVIANRGGSSGFGDVNASSSFVIVRGTEAPSVTRDGGAQQCWNLPWAQQRVIMCPYCHRPVRPTDAPTRRLPNASGDTVDSTDLNSGEARDSERNLSSDSFTLDNDLESDDDDETLLEEEAQTAGGAYCRCEHRQSAKTPHSTGGPALGASPAGRSMSGPTFTSQASGSVFVMRTERSSTQRITGVIAEGSSDSDSEDDSACRKKGSQKLCLVTSSPAPTVQNVNSRSEVLSPKSKVNAWATEQRRGE